MITLPIPITITLINLLLYILTTIINEIKPTKSTPKNIILNLISSLLSILTFTIYYNNSQHFKEGKLIFYSIAILLMYIILIIIQSTTKNETKRILTSLTITIIYSFILGTLI